MVSCIVPWNHWNLGVEDDVTCLSRLSSTSGLLATGGDDGYVCFWKIQDLAGNQGCSSMFIHFQ